MEARNDLTRTACAFALSGKSQIVTDKSAKLIQLGIASTVVDVNNGEYVSCRIDEPLIIQACINLLRLQKVVELEMISSKNEADMGFAFENFMLPQLQLRLEEVVTQEVRDERYGAELAGFQVPTLSSYGVLSKVCHEPSETIDWLKLSSNTRFEGSLEPFCKPDPLLGPDVLCLLRDKNFAKRLLAVQTKLRYKVNQLEALRTIQPALFYVQNRGKDNQSKNEQLGNEEAQDWLVTHNSLFSPRPDEEPPTKVAKTGEDRFLPRTQPIVRMLVQFPAEKSRNSASGVVKFADVSVSQSVNSEGNELDALIVIDRNNSHSLFGVQEQKLLAMLKSIDGDSCPDSFDPTNIESAGMTS